MADLSRIKVLETAYEIKDSSARDSIDFIIPRLPNKNFTNVQSIQIDAGQNLGIQSFEVNNSAASPGSTAFTVYQFGDNVFDKASIRFKAGYYLNYNGVETSGSSFAYSYDYILVNPNTKYNINFNSTSSQYYIQCYSKNKTRLSAIQSYSSGSSNRYFTTPNNCFYIRFNVLKSKQSASTTGSLGYITQNDPYISNKPSYSNYAGNSQTFNNINNFPYDIKNSFIPIQNEINSFILISDTSTLSLSAQFILQAYSKPTTGIPSSDIANAAITSDKIQVGAVTAGKIQSNAVTESNLTNDLRNQIYNIPKYITVHQNIPYSQLDTFLSIPIGKYASSMYITSGSNSISRWKELLGSFSEPLIPIKLNNEIKFFPLFQLGSEISCEDCGEGYYYNGIDILTNVSSAGVTTYSPLYAYFPYESDLTYQVSDHSGFDTSCIYSAERPSCNDSCEDCGDCDWPGCEDCGESYCADCGEGCADCGESYCADCGEGSSSRTITVENTTLEIPEGYSTWGSILGTNIIPKYNNNPCIVKGSSIGTKSFFSNYLYYSANGSSDWKMLALVEEVDGDVLVLSYVKYTDSFDFNPSHHYKSRYYHICEDDGSMWGCEDCGEI